VIRDIAEVRSDPPLIGAWGRYGTVGPPGSVCDSVTGACTMTASPGDCCEADGGCFGRVISNLCTGSPPTGFGGQYFPNTICMPNGRCQ